MKDAPRISFCRNKYPLKPPIDPRAGVPFPVDATFVISVNLAGSTCGASARRTPLRLHSTSGWSRTVRSEQIPSRIVSDEEAALDSVLFLNVAVSVVCQDRWHCLSDFASSLPGHVCGHCGPPSHKAGATWLRQQCAQYWCGVGTARKKKG